MFLPSLSHPACVDPTGSSYMVYVGPDGIDGKVRLLADCHDGVPSTVAVMMDGVGMAGWLVQNLYR